MKKKLTIVWIVLIVFTLISAIISTNFSDNKYAINMIIFLAVLKFIGVSFYLMELKKALKTENFIRYVLTNVDTSLAATDENVMALYADLVEDEKVKKSIYTLLKNEFLLTQEMMLELLGSPISDRRKNHFYSTQLRAKALYPLHQIQVELLKKWRTALKRDDKQAAANLQTDLLRSINAIANAMGTTG